MSARSTAAILAALAAASTACTTMTEEVCEPQFRTMFSTRGTLVGIESEASAARLPEFPREKSVTTNGIERELRALPDTFVFRDDRVAVPFGAVRLEFRWPETTGSTTLAALDAKVCEYDTNDALACRPVDGSVEVVESTPACGDRACGALDLSIHIATEVPIPEHAVVQGDARLRWAEVNDEICRNVVSS